MTNALGKTAEVHLLNAGASSCQSSFVLHESSFDSGTNHVVQSNLCDASVIRVDCLTIDELNPPAKSLIKIDVEGHELEVLKGMTDLSDKGECIIIFEHWHETTHALEPFYKYFSGFGYSIYQIQTELTDSDTPDFTRVKTTLHEPSLHIGGRYNLMAVHNSRRLRSLRSLR
jgi:hypothetical protein